MSDKTTIASAGNVLPAALAALRQLGYVVTLTNNGRLCKAENDQRTLIAEDVLLLLGLAKLHEARGNAWAPTDEEVESYLVFDKAQTDSTSERVSVWEECGSVHVLCVSAFGDPVELGEQEAIAFSAQLNKAIAKAGQSDA